MTPYDATDDAKQQEKAVKPSRVEAEAAVETLHGGRR